MAAQNPGQPFVQIKKDAISCVSFYNKLIRANDTSPRSDGHDFFFLIAAILIDQGDMLIGQVLNTAFRLFGKVFT